MPKTPTNPAKHNQNCAKDADVDGQTDDWSSEEEDDDQPAPKSRRTSCVVTGPAPGETGVSAASSPASVTAGAGRTKGAIPGHAHGSGDGETHRSSNSKCAFSVQSCRGGNRGFLSGLSEGLDQVINVRGGESPAPPDVAGWGPREVKRLVYGRGNYTSDPCDVIAELTLDDVTDAAPPTTIPDNTTHSLPASGENQKSPPPSTTPTVTAILEFFKHRLRNLDGVRILGRTVVLSEDVCILSQLVGPDRHRHRRRVEAIVDMSPESDSAVGEQEDGGTQTTSTLGGSHLQDRRRAAAEILHTNMFSLQQRLLLAARQVWFGENLTVYLADKMLAGILGALSVLTRTHGVRRNFVLDNNPSVMTLVGEGGPDTVLHTGRPDFMIYVRTETIHEPELFCLVDVKKKCPTVNSSIPTDGKTAKKTKAGGTESTSTCRQRVRWHEAGDNSVKKRLADITFRQAGGELLGHLLLTYANNFRTCFMDNKYLGIIVHGTKMQLVVVKMKNVDLCVDSVKQGGTKPTKKLCVLYSPNLDYFVPEERQQLLQVLVNLIL